MVSSSNASDSSGDSGLADATLVSKEREAPGSQSLPPGQTVGRYVLLDLVGRGAMGVVYAAYDPELDRRIALKLVRASSSSAERQARLLREAQSMAKLAHPNVVAVHDVGTHDQGIFVAMEFVHGQTLAQWMRQPHHWTEVRDVFRQAAAGLHAAHASGVVHRDFKPDNVMLGDDGRVRVMDFGLARAAGMQSPGQDGLHGHDAVGGPALVAEPDASELGATAGPEDAARSSAPGTASLTRTGAVLGTPAYMAPEQHLGERAEAPSDQFAFCVAMLEALYGERPFAGDTVAAVAFAVTQGNVREAPRGADVPSWLRRTLIRGLAVDPMLRHPSMLALDESLARDPAAVRRGWAVVALLVAGVAAAVVVTQTVGTETAPPACTQVAAPVRTVWNDDVAVAMSTAFDATGVPHAGKAFTAASASFDAYADLWAATRVDACAATRLREEQSQELMDLRMACLDERLQAMSTTVELLSKPDVVSVNEAAHAASSLPSLGRCSDPTILRAAVPPPEDPGATARIAEVRRELVRARALGETGKPLEARARSDALVRDARATEWEPVLVEALFVHATALGATHETAPALEAAEEAFFAAHRLRLDAEAARAASLMIYLRGYQLADREGAAVWTKLARAAAMRVEDSDEVDAIDVAINVHEGAVENLHGGHARAAELYRMVVEELEMREQVAAFASDYMSALGGLGTAYERLGEVKAARQWLERGREVATASMGDSHPMVASMLEQLGALDHLAGDLDAAEAQFRRALGIREATFGPDHVNITTSLSNLSSVAQRRGDLAAATAFLDRALRISEVSLGPDHADVGTQLFNLGNVRYLAGDLGQAEALYERARTIWTDRLGRDHADVALTIDQLASIADDRGHAELALERLAESERIKRAALGDEHPDLALTLSNRGHVLEGMGRRDEARRSYRAAVRIRRAALGPEARVTLLSRVDVTRASIDLGESAGVIDELATLVQAYRNRAGDPGGLGAALFEHGRALAETGERARASECFAEALALFADDAEARAEILAWAKPRRLAG